MSKSNWKSIAGEFIGSMFISFWGLGLVVPFAVLGYIGSTYEFAVWFGLAFAVTVIVFAPISGVHVNPAVTVAWAMFGGFDRKLILPYWIAQILGWGAGIVPFYVIYGNVFDEWALSTGGNPASLFYCSVSADHLLAGAGLEIFLTAMLTFAIFVLLDERIPGRPSSAGFPWAIGIVISLIIAFGGGFTGACINPARDLGPRLFGVVYGLINGYDVSMIFGNSQWLMYIIAPIIGGILGGWFHFKVIVKLLPSSGEAQK